MSQLQDRTISKGYGHFLGIVSINNQSGTQSKLFSNIFGAVIIYTIDTTMEEGILRIDSQSGKLEVIGSPDFQKACVAWLRNYRNAIAVSESSQNTFNDKFLKALDTQKGILEHLLKHLPQSTQEQSVNQHQKNTQSSTIQGNNTLPHPTTWSNKKTLSILLTVNGKDMNSQDYLLLVIFLLLEENESFQITQSLLKQTMQQANAPFKVAVSTLSRLVRLGFILNKASKSYAISKAGMDHLKSHHNFMNADLYPSSHNALFPFRQTISKDFQYEETFSILQQFHANIDDSKDLVLLSLYLIPQENNCLMVQAEPIQKLFAQMKLPADKVAQNLSFLQYKEFALRRGKLNFSITAKGLRYLSSTLKLPLSPLQVFDN